MKSLKAKHMNRCGLVLLLLLSFGSSLHAINIPHLVYGTLRYSDDSIPESVTFNAYMQGRVDEVLTQTSVGCGYQDGQWWVQVANFGSAWDDGEVLVIEFDDLADGTGDDTYTLTNDAADNAGQTTLRRPAREIIIQVTPNTLDFVVDDTTYTGSHLFRWEQGLSHTITAGNTIPEGTDTRYVFSSWSDAGAASHNYTVPNTNATITATYETQHKLKIDSEHGGTNGTSWHSEGQVVSVSVTSPDYVTNSERYNLLGWSGVGEGSYTGSSKSFTVTMDEPIIETATWAHQFQLVTDVEPSSGGTIGLNPTGGWYNEGVSVAVTAQPADDYAFIRWEDDLSTTATAETVTMDEAHNITAVFGREVDITILTSPLDLEFEVDGTSYSQTHTFNWVEGETYDFTVTSPQAGASGVRYVFKNWSQGGTQNQTYTVPGNDANLTINFTTQYEVTINTSYGDPKGWGWHNANSNITVAVDSLDEILSGEERYVFTGWSGDKTSANASFTITEIQAPWTVTASFGIHQYYLNINSNFGNPQGEGWYNENAVASISVTSPDTVTSGSKTKYIFNGWTGDVTTTATQVNNIIMDGPVAVGTNWTTQYYFTFLADPPEGGEIPDRTGWYNAGDYVLLDTLSVADGFEWGGWYGDGVTDGDKTVPQNLQIIQPKTVRAKFNREGSVVVTTDPPGLSFHVDGTLYEELQVFDWLEGETHSVSVSAESQQGDDQTRYVFLYWRNGGDDENVTHQYSVPATDDTVTAVFRTDYYVTVNSVRGEATASAWHEAGENIPISVDSLVLASAGTRYRMSGWAGTGSGSYTGTDTSFTITNLSAPITQTANWETQYQLDIQSEYGNPTGAGWYAAGTAVQFGATTPVPVGTDTQYVFISWTGTGTGSYSGTQAANHVVNMNNPITEVATWQIQYYLHISKFPSEGGLVSPPAPGGWYNAGAIVNLTATPASGYQWHGWSGDLISSQLTGSVEMTGTKSVSAAFGEEVFILIDTEPTGLKFKVQAQGSSTVAQYTAPYTFTWIIGSKYTLSVDDNQNGGTGIRHPFLEWSDGEAISHTYTVPDTHATISAQFSTQYYLEVKPESKKPGTTTGSGWYDADSSAVFTVTPRIQPVDSDTVTRYIFDSWSGTGNNAYNGSDTSYTIVMTGPVTEVAKYVKQYFLITYSLPEDDGHTVPASPGAWYDEGTSAEVTAVPEVGRQFARWTGASSSTENPIQILMNEPKEVTAKFGEAMQVTVKTEPEGLEFKVNGTAYTQSKVFSIAKSSLVNLEVEETQIDDSEKKRYIFTSWSQGEGSDPTIDIESDIVLTAYFTEQCYLEVQSPYSQTYGTGWHNTGSSIKFGVVKTSYAGSDGERFVFSKWTSSVTSGYTGTDSVSQVVVKEPLIQYAKWDTVYLLTHNVSPIQGGSVVRTPNDQWYKRNSVVELVAVPNTNNQYEFSGWTGDVVSSNDTIEVRIKRPTTVTANFSGINHTVTKAVQPDASYGSIVVDPELTQFVHGTTVTFRAVPSSGYKFDHWEGDVSGTDAEIIVTVNSDMELKAHFVKWDTTPPKLTNAFPASDAVSVLVNADIGFNVVDDIYGVDLSTLNISIGGRTVVQSGVDKTSGEIDLTSMYKGYRFAYHPTVAFDTARVIQVAVTCKDLANPTNSLSTSYSFKTGKSQKVSLKSMTVNPSGATVKSSTGIKVEIPNGALDDTTTITIDKISNPPALPDTIKGVGSAYHFGPDGLEFESPVVVTLPYTDEDLKNAGILNVEKLKIFYYSTTIGKWQQLQVLSIDKQAKLITVSVDHFSYFQISSWTESKAAMAMEGFAGLYNYPNPFNPLEGGTYLTFQLKKDAVVTIKIYDATSRLVRILEEDLTCTADERVTGISWDGKNDSGDLVANNVYFCVLESTAGERVIRKIALIR